MKAFLVSLLILSAARFADAATCESLTSLKLQDTTITLAETVAPGGFVPPGPRGGRGGAGPQINPYSNLPAFCRVAATLKPSSDSDIKIEVWLPASGWNTKFEAVGNGGWSGNISYPALADGVRRGYATASTDTGHEGGSGSFALGHPEKLIDFAYRAVHELTVKGKAITEAYYGANPKYSYWNGCSSGGKQGLKEAQKFPDDFDGIIAGAPANYWTHLTAGDAWVGQAVNKTVDNYIPPSKYSLIHTAAMNSCDALDGVKDNVIENPKKCKFDPSVLLCKGDDTSTCLTSAQVETTRVMYAPVMNPVPHKALFPGFEPGSEPGWSLVAGRQPTSLGIDYWKYVVFKDPNWDYKAMDFDQNIALGDEVDKSVGINAIDTNLQPFFSHGGKLLQYHGWTDALIPPQNSIDYYQSVVKAMGGVSKVQNSYRLFMAPGLNHCGGGDGPTQFDTLAALEQWVEKGKAPDQIIASRPGRTRPLCPYPQVAGFKGSGSTDEAANFACR